MAKRKNADADAPDADQVAEPDEEVAAPPAAGKTSKPKKPQSMLDRALVYLRGQGHVIEDWQVAGFRLEGGKVNVGTTDGRALVAEVGELHAAEVEAVIAMKVIDRAKIKAIDRNPRTITVHHVAGGKIVSDTVARAELG